MDITISCHHFFLLIGTILATKYSKTRRRPMNNKALITRIAQLESLNDQLLSELQFLDAISRELGFSDGVNSLKSAAKELLNEQKDNTKDEDKKNYPPYF
jgi:hypothetical protein